MRLTGKLLGLVLCAGGAWLPPVRGQTVVMPPPTPLAPAAPAYSVLPETPGCGAGKCASPASDGNPFAHRGCNSFIGQWLDAALSPVRIATGGLIRPCCPTLNQPNPADLMKPPDSPAGAAARIKLEEAESLARRVDVRYLGTVDCHRYPEAEKALIKALRTDRNECVRWEAALSLGNGCCCTRCTVEALLLTANGSDHDGNPVETSLRVKQAAARALAHCQSRGGDFTPEPPERPPLAAGEKGMTEPPPVDPAAPPMPIPYRPRGLLQNIGWPTTCNAASCNSATCSAGTSGQRGIVQTSATSTAPPPPANPPAANGKTSNSGVVPTGQRGLWQIFMRRVQSTTANTP